MQNAPPQTWHGYDQLATAVTKRLGDRAPLGIRDSRSGGMILFMIAHQVCTDASPLASDAQAMIDGLKIDDITQSIDHAIALVLATDPETIAYHHKAFIGNMQCQKLNVAGFTRHMQKATLTGNVTAHTVLSIEPPAAPEIPVSGTIPETCRITALCRVVDRIRTQMKGLMGYETALNHEITQASLGNPAFLAHNTHDDHAAKRPYTVTLNLHHKADSVSVPLYHADKVVAVWNDKDGTGYVVVTDKESSDTWGFMVFKSNTEGAVEGTMYIYNFSEDGFQRFSAAMALSTQSPDRQAAIDHAVQGVVHGHTVPEQVREQLERAQNYKNLKTQQYSGAEMLDAMKSQQIGPQSSIADREVIITILYALAATADMGSAQVRMSHHT